MAGFYVRRDKATTPGGFVWVGPIRSERQAEREAAAWNGCDPAYAAVVVPSDPATRRAVREWSRNVRAIRYGTFPGPGRPNETAADLPRFTHGRFTPTI